MTESDRLGSKSKSGQNFYIWELNPQTKQILVSAITEGVDCFPFESNIENILAAIHPDDFAGLTEKLRRAQAGLEPLGEEVRFIHPATGEIVWFRIGGSTIIR